MQEEERTSIWSTLVDWSATAPIDLCVLFGSMATGQTHLRSDVDLAVWPAAEPTLDLRLRWIGELQERTSRDVSLVLVGEDLDPVLGFEIVRDGKVVMERRRGLWNRELSRLWHAYNDSSPFRRAAREDLRRWCEEVRRGT